MTLSMREDANEGNPVDLSTILKLVQDRDEALEEVETAAEVLKTKQKYFDKLDQFTIPEALQEVGLTEVTLEDGRTVGYKESIYCHITDEKRASVMTDIRNRGFANIIDNTITLKFTAAQSDEVFDARLLLDQAGYSYKVKEAVHASRLKSFVQERVQEGDDIPLELYGAHVVNKTKVKTKRK